MENPDILEYKNFYLFYKNLYERLFNLINLLIDEKEYNIIKLKNYTIDFLDNYSYYLLKQKLIEVEDKEKKALLDQLKDFDEFYKGLNKYPTIEYSRHRLEMIRNNYDLKKLLPSGQDYIVKEYYFFFQECLNIIKQFVSVTSDCGFLPNIKSKTALKSIGYANYDIFFTNLENLKQKASEITTNINLSNTFISRRCMYCILVVFSPYFKNQQTAIDLEKDLNFNFLNDDKILYNLRRVNSYDDLNKIPFELSQELEKDLINPLKLNISLIKRFTSYEFGERDMSPTIKKKYSYDPTGV